MRQRVGGIAGFPVLVLVLALVLGLPRPSAGKSRVDSWNARLQETVGLLHAGGAIQARSTIAPVIEEMTREINPGKKAAHAFGLALMLRALAEAGSGNEREAIWDWHVAQQFDPPLEGWDLAEFGSAGEVLSRHRLARDPVPTVPTADELEKEGAQKPILRKPNRQAEYVEKSRLRRWQGSIVLQALVGVDGLPAYPRIVQSSEELGIVLSACEFVRELRFEPARRNGASIPAIWDLTMNYRLQ